MRDHLYFCKLACVNYRPASFNEAAKAFGELASSGKLSNEEKLEGYGLFKQATIGDNTTAKAKWKAWESRKGLSKEEAQKNYIELNEKLQKK
ncbi:7444_t:CDS:2 [Entrophospora sp. SA101]|nr:7444_t:CDS:2 [Entrophospora sp. SA101]